MTRDEILSDLRKVYGPRVLLSPRDIALAIGRSPKAQAHMRSRGIFPMPVKRSGGRVGVSVYDLAEYLSGDAPTESAVSAAEPDAAPVKAKRAQTAKKTPAADPKRRKLAAAPEAWLPARSRRSLGPDLVGFRAALDYWAAAHAELEAAELAARISGDGPGTGTGLGRAPPRPRRAEP